MLIVIYICSNTICNKNLENSLSFFNFPQKNRTWLIKTVLYFETILCTLMLKVILSKKLLFQVDWTRFIRAMNPADLKNVALSKVVFFLVCMF